MSIPKVFVAESAYKKSLSLLNQDKDDDSLEGKEYAIKARVTKKGTAKNDEFKLTLAALTSAGTLSLSGGKGQDELSFSSKSPMAVTLGKKSQIKSLSITQDGTLQKVKNASFAGFEQYEFGGSGKVTLSAEAERTIATGTLLEVDTGSGSDKVTFGAVSIKGGTGTGSVTGLEIDTGSGKDRITIGDVAIANNGYVAIDAGKGADTITLGKVAAPRGIVLLEGDTGKDVCNLKAGSTAKILIEEEGKGADTVNMAGASKSRFETAAKAGKNLSFALKTAKDDGKTEYCLTVRGVAKAKNEGAGGSFSIIAKNFQGDKLNILTAKNKLIASISLADVAANVKADGKFHKLTLAKEGTALKVAASSAGSVTKNAFKTVGIGWSAQPASAVYGDGAEAAAFSKYLSATAPVQPAEQAAGAKALQNAVIAQA